MGLKLKKKAKHWTQHCIMASSNTSAQVKPLSKKKTQYRGNYLCVSKTEQEVLKKKNPNPHNTYLQLHL